MMGVVCTLSPVPHRIAELNDLEDSLRSNGSIHGVYGTTGGPDRGQLGGVARAT